MRTAVFASSLLSAASLVHAQLAYDPATKNLVCAKPDGVYCAGDSLAQTIIVHCKGGVAVPACCTAELSSLPPLGVKSTALCFQSSVIAGDAACSLNGTVYPQSGAAYALPAPSKPAIPIPAVISLGDEPPKNCGCHNGTHPLGPAGPSGPVASPAQPSTPVTPISPVKPPVGSAPVSSIHPSGSAAPIPVHSSKPYPTSLASGWNPKPTVTPTTTAGAVASGAAARSTIPGLALALGFAAMFI